MDGQAVKITSPTRANQLGIGMVHQHFMLVDAFTVTENIILGSEMSTNGMLDTQKPRKKSLVCPMIMDYRSIQMRISEIYRSGCSSG